MRSAIITHVDAAAAGRTSTAKSAVLLLSAGSGQFEVSFT